MKPSEYATVKSLREEFSILAYLGSLPLIGHIQGREIRQGMHLSDIARHTHVSSEWSARERIDMLERAGLAERCKSIERPRLTLWRITDTGRAELAKTQKEVQL